MNKILGSIALLLTLLCAGYTPASARQTGFAGARASNPIGARAQYAPQVCRTALSGTCVVCSTAGKTGIITSIDVSSGAVGSWAVALDTGAIPTAGLSGPPAASGAGSLIARQKTCEYTLATVDTNKGDCGAKNFPDGRPFSSGLTICASADVHAVVEFYDITIP